MTTFKDLTRKFTKGIGAAIAVSLVASLPMTSPTVSAVAVTGATYTPTAPCTLLDTRVDAPGKLAAAQTVTIPVTGRCGIPTSATSVMLAVTAVNTEAAGHAVGWDGVAAKPTTSILNWDPASRLAGTSVLPLSPTGSVKVWVSSPTHLLVSVLGSYTPSPSPVSAGRYKPVTPARLFDSRDTSRPAPGSVVTVALPGTPTDAVAVAITLTTTASLGSDWFGVAAGGSTPTVSVLNTDAPGQTRAVYAVVPVGPGGISIRSNAGNHMFVDLVGYYTGGSFSASTDGLFVATPPSRLTDTRSDGPQMYPGGIRSWSTASLVPGAAAVMATITVTKTNKQGFATLYAAGTPTPPTSSVNASHSWQSIANLATPQVSTEGVAVKASMGTHVIIDVYGYFLGSPVSATDTATSNPVPVVNTSGPVVDGSCIPAGTSVSVDEFNKVWTGYPSLTPTWLVVSYPRTGWRGPIVVLGDTLTMQSAVETTVALRQAGYGPICVDGLAGRTVLPSAGVTSTGVARATSLRSSSVWGSRDVRWVIALGSSDVSTLTDAAGMTAVQTQQRVALGSPRPPQQRVR